MWAIVYHLLSEKMIQSCISISFGILIRSWIPKQYCLTYEVLNVFSIQILKPRLEIIPQNILLLLAQFTRGDDFVINIQYGSSHLTLLVNPMMSETADCDKWAVLMHVASGLLRVWPLSLLMFLFLTFSEVNEACSTHVQAQPREKLN